MRRADRFRKAARALGCVGLLAGCGVAEGAARAPAPEPAPAPVAADTLAPPAREPQAAPPSPLPQERWAAPFAVLSRGRVAPRGARTVVVVADSAGPAPAAPVAAAPAPRDSAARPAAGAGRPAPAPPAGRAATPAAPATPSAGGRTHRVEWGETWYGIAREYEVSARDLAAANPEVDPERLRSGQVLRIPRAAGRAPQRRTHTVGSGDTLWGIAHRYGVTPEAIRRANRLSDDLVRLGQTLVIPQEETRR